MNARAPTTGMAAVAILVFASTACAQLAVVSTSPPLNASNVDLRAPIVVNFDRPVNPATFTSDHFWAFGRSSGTVVGTITFSNGNQSVTLTPDHRFQPGEPVMVILAHHLRGADGSALRQAGYSWQFWTRVRCAGWDLQQIASMSNRLNDEQTRIYGGNVCDFNNDGWVDIATINEVSADMRMFLNRADGSGLFHPWLQPPEALDFESSPNEAHDFNRDGHADLAVASSYDNTASFLLGNGDGTFQPKQTLAAGNISLGVAVLDADGDGDVDVAVANFGTNNISLMLNNGAGVFAFPTFFDGGVNGEYGMTHGDMNNDGIMDIIVGGFSSQTIRVLIGNGDGTFTPQPAQNVGGGVWVIVAGDVNGDRKLDIAAANSYNNNGAILIGNGNGTFQPPVTYPTFGHAPSSDLGDIDGDGDLDWILSGFGGRLWRLLRNDGTGTFEFYLDIDAPSNPSCAAVGDLDNDGDLDVILFDELADVVVLLRNNATRPAGDVTLDGQVDLNDLAVLLSHFGTASGATLDDGDVDGNGQVDLNDLTALLATFGAACG